MECPKNLTKEQILRELSKDDIGTCNECPNLIYKNGMLVCVKASDDLYNTN